MLENRQQTEDETINGYVDHIIYRNADNGYTVLVMICDEEEVTCVDFFGYCRGRKYRSTWKL